MSSWLISHIIMKWPSLPLLIFFPLQCTFSDNNSHSSFLKNNVNIVYLSPSFMFHLFLFLYLKWIIYKQHMVESLKYIFFHSTNLSLLIGLLWDHWLWYDYWYSSVQNYHLAIFCPNSACYPMSGNCCFPYFDHSLSRSCERVNPLTVTSLLLEVEVLYVLFFILTCYLYLDICYYIYGH